MTSDTKKTELIRRRKERKRGKDRKKLTRTPAFPIHPQGYNPSASDAKPSTTTTKDS